MTPEPLRSRSSRVVAFALMKLVEKIKGLFRKQPLTDERIAALAEAESRRNQVSQQAGEIRSNPGRQQTPP